ncbi:TPA: hypothetical protein KEY88_005314 [Serratia marcescens]|nr:hypothetical protein [Serratia marcescens]
MNVEAYKVSVRIALEDQITRGMAAIGTDNHSISTTSNSSAAFRRGDCIFRPKPIIDSDISRSHFPI